LPFPDPGTVVFDVTDVIHTLQEWHERR
jgi:hypothetical protein